MSRATEAACSLQHRNKLLLVWQQECKTQCVLQSQHRHHTHSPLPTTASQPGVQHHTSTSSSTVQALLKLAIYTQSHQCCWQCFSLPAHTHRPGAPPSLNAQHRAHTPHAAAKASPQPATDASECASAVPAGVAPMWPPRSLSQRQNCQAINSLQFAITVGSLGGGKQNATHSQ